MSARKPVILIVHGSWHQPAHFDLQIEALHQAGYSTHCPLLPSTAGFADVGVAQDAARIRQELDLILTPDAQGHVPDVVVFGHSYGGVVMADSVLPRYSKRSRTLTGRKGGVVRLVYASAFLLVPGQCLVDAFPGTGLLPPFLDHESTGMVALPEAGRRAALYADLSTEQRDKYLALLTPCPAITLLSTVSNVPHLHIPSTYIHCTEDQAVPLGVQKWMVAYAELLGAKIDTVECVSSHSLYISQPQYLVDLLNGLPAISSQDLSAKHQEQTAKLGAVLQEFIASKAAAAS